MHESEIIEAWQYAWNRTSYYMYINGISREDREDICSGASIIALVALAHFRKESRLGTYFSRIFRNFFFQHLRKNRRVLHAFDVSSPLHITTDKEWCIHSVSEALSVMDCSEKHLLTLREVEGRSYRSISSILGIPQGTVMSRLNTARKNFRSHYYRSQGRDGRAV